MAKPAVQVDHLKIIYNQGKANEFFALKDLSVDIYPREYIILFGPSGCGKSTLLYTILGGVPPADGRMVVQGEDIYRYSAEEMNRYQQQTIGIVYQQFNLIPSITVLDNVALPRIFMNVSPEERNKRAGDLLERFGINEKLAKKTPTLMSGGQQQRVAVARALINDPEILLADEPVGNLDSISAEHVMDSLEVVNQRDRKTVILVTHDAKYLPYAHRVFYMRDGVLRRIVVNPEKEQVKRVKPGETIVTEIEQLARLYPYAEPIDLKVKSIVNYATQKFDFTQLERLEKAILHVLKGQMDRAMFADFLARGLHEGGMGMYIAEVEPMTQRIFALAHYSRDVARYREDVHKDEMFLHQRKFIDRLYAYISEEIFIEPTKKQCDVLRTALAERVAGIIGADDFEERLVLPYDMGGANFGEVNGHRISRYLEKLIAQGGYLIRQNELLGSHT